jgi:DNA anti-recombination protein RmuC
VIESRFSKIAELVTERGPAMITSLSEQAIGMENALEGKLSDFGESIRSKIEDVSETLENNAHRIAEALDHRSRQINQTLIERTREIAETFTSGQTEFAAAIDDRLIEVGGQMTTRIETLAETLTERANSITDSLAGKSHDVAETVRDAVAEVTQRLVTESGEATRALRASASEASTVLGRAINEIEGMFGARANAVTEALEQRTREFNDVLGARSGELASLLDGRSNALLKTLDQRGNDIVEMVVSRSEEAARTLLESGERVASTFVDTNDRLRTEVAGIAERLAQSNDLLNELLSSTSQNLGKIETQLATRSTEFSTVIGHAVEVTQLSANELGDQVSRLRDISGEILDGVSNVVKRFEEQSQSLTTASKNLSDVNRQIETTVDERRPALESLTVGLKSRSEELDGLMKSFTRIITETLKTAEERATSVSRMLTENTATATKGVIENFETMNRTATSEGRKAAEAVRDANKALLAEMSQAIGDATRRFADATREMRQAAQALQQDLSATRDELKREVLDLPEEARESAEAMRRVVGDQIRALSELSEIVTRHGKTLDLSTPSLGEPRLRAVEAPPAVAAIGAEPAQTSARFATEGRRGPNGGQSPARPTPRVVSRTPPAPQPRGDDGNEGWVSDLLRRASTEEELNGGEPPAAPADEDAGPAHAAEANGGEPSHPASSQPVSPALGTLSADIARAIDHEAASELWQRHQRGERSVFTRRLYTLEGQQTFDDIRKKYQRDSEFRSVVDRYVADFEKLLGEVTREGQDPNAGNAYLTSDTGKVYTMLAHASGRLE